MGYLIINKDHDGLREEMRRNYRMGGYHHEGYSPMMRHDGRDYEEGYRMGYRHAMEDSDEEYRRARDSKGRYI